MRRKIAALLLIFAILAPAVPVFASAAQPAQINIVIADGMATWDAVEGATGHNVEFMTRTGFTTLFFTEPEIDLAQALSRLDNIRTTDYQSFTVRARNANMVVLAEGVAMFRINADGSSSGSTYGQLVLLCEDGETTETLHTPVYAYNGLAYVPFTLVDSLLDMQLGLFYPGSWEGFYRTYVTVDTATDFGWSNWWILFPVGQAELGQTLTVKQAGGQSWFSAWHLADAFELDYSFDPDEMVIKIAGEPNFSWQLDIDITDGIATWNVPQRVGRVTHEGRLGINTTEFVVEFDYAEADLAELIERFSPDRDPGLVRLTMWPMIAGAHVAAGEIGFRLNQYGQVVEAPLFDRIVGLRSQTVEDNSDFVGDTFFTRAFVDDGRILVPHGVLWHLMNVGAQLNHQTLSVDFRLYDRQDYQVVKVHTFAVGEMAEGMEVLLKLAAGELWVPIRFIAETFGYDIVFWADEFVIELVQ